MILRSENSIGARRSRLAVARHVIFVEMFGESLVVVLCIRDHDVIYESAGHARGFGIGVAVANFFDLRDDDATAVVRGLCHREYFADETFALVTQVAVAVGARGAQKRDLNRERVIPQPILAIKGNALDQIFRRALIHFTAAILRIDESVHPNFSEKSGPSRRDFAEQNHRVLPAENCKPRFGFPKPARPAWAPNSSDRRSRA